MKFFDSHAHLDDEKFNDDREEIIEKIHNDEIENFVSAGYSLEGSKKAVELSKKYEFIYATCGISPNDIPQTEDELWKDLAEISNLVKKNNKVVAIGEIGLDYYYDNSPREVQKEWFKKQIELANELKLPIIIHDRDAHQDTFEIIKNTKSPEIGCVLHCYSGNVELAKEYVKMGCYISIN